MAVPDSLQAVRALDFTAAQLADAMNVCFEDYVMPFTLSAEQLDRRFRRETLDALASTVWQVNKEWAAVVFVARRGRTARIAAMAVAKPHRGKGVGKFVMREAVQEAEERGDDRMLLEVIEQNPPAIALYESVGFQNSRRLVGYERAGRPTTGQVKAERCDPLEVARELVRSGSSDLPWDLAPESLAALAPPTEGFCLQGDCFALATDTPSQRVLLWSLFTRPGARRQGLATNMLDHLQARFAGKTLVTPVTVPDDLAPGFLKAVGFNEVKVSQLEMRRSLGQPASS